MTELSTTPKIAIVGGGPSGLTCARILTQAGISVKVFERDEGPQARAQGGTLDLHEGTGLDAVKRAGLFSEFQAHARYEGEDMVISDRHGTVHFSLVDQALGRPEIDRKELRRILIDSLPDSTIRWNSRLRSAEPGKLHFEHGTEDGFDLIIGADGAWSKVRPLLTPVPPFYSGVSGFEFRIRDVEERYPRIAEQIGRGSHYAWGSENGRSCIAQRNGDGSARVYVFMMKPETWLKEDAATLPDPAAVRTAMIDELAGWAPQFKEWIENSDDGAIPRALYMLPVGLKWPTRPGVTLLGDAAHLMTPFAGEGANVAMADAMKLAENIIANPHDLHHAVHDYESWMFQASTEKTQQTWMSLLERFDFGGAESMAIRVNRLLKTSGEQQTHVTEGIAVAA